MSDEQTRIGQRSFLDEVREIHAELESAREARPIHLKPSPPETIRPRGWHYTMAALALANVIAVVLALINAVPLLDTSIVSLVARGVTGAALLEPSTIGSGASRVESIAMLVFLGLVVVALFGRRSRGVHYYAMIEEVKYRGGSEYWSWAKRLWVSLRFGLGHLWNLVIPLGAALGVAVGGLWFLAVYLRTHARTGSRVAALQHAAAVHAAYNTLIFYVLLPAIALGTIAWVVLTS